MLPMVSGPDQPVARCLEVAWRIMLAPCQCAETVLTGFHHVACGESWAFEAKVEVAHHSELQVVVLDARLVIAITGVDPAFARTPVIESGLAFQADLHLAVHTADGAK